MSTLGTENPQEPVHPTSYGRPDSPVNEPPPTGTVNKVRGFVNEKATSFVGFFRTIYGILNIVIIVAIACILISAGTADGEKARLIDDLGGFSSVKVSAYHTRNADIAFAIFGLLLILADTILYTTGLIKRLPKLFDFIFNISMIVIGVIYFILGCCSAAWIKKSSDTKIGGLSDNWRIIASAVASTFFLFIAMLAVLVNFVLRLIRPIRRDTE